MNILYYTAMIVTGLISFLSMLIFVLVGLLVLNSFDLFPSHLLFISSLVLMGLIVIVVVVLGLVYAGLL